MSIQALREQRNELSRQANHLLAEKGTQVWTKEEQAKFDDLANQIERADQQIAAHQRIIDERVAEIIPANKDSDPEKVKARGAFELLLRKMTKDISAEEWTLIRNTMSTTTGSQGGYTVAPQVATELIETMKDFGAIRRACSRLVTSNGADLSYPGTDGTADVGEIVAQNSAAGSGDPSFGTVALNVVKFGSKKIGVPIELLQDSSIDVVAMVLKRIRDRVGRIQNQKFTTGTGTGEPNGLVTAASVGKTGTTGQTLTVIYDDLVDLVDSIDMAYQAEGDLSWMFSQTVRKVIRKIKDTSGRPIWTPSYDTGIVGASTPDRLLDFPVQINNDMPVPAANAKSIAFGQLRKYMVRDAMDIQIFRFEDSAFISNGQVGFLGWARAGGNLLDTAAVKLYQHSAT